MNITTNQTEDISLQSAWDCIKTDLLQVTTAISVRVTETNSIENLDVSGAYGEDLTLNTKERTVLKQFVQAATSVCSAEIDCITISDGYAITTTTMNSVESDQELFRRMDMKGSYREDAEGFTLYTLSEGPVNVPAFTEIFDREPIDIKILDTQKQSKIDMSHTGSFDVSASKIVIHLGLEEAMVFEEDEEDGRLVCDIHESPDGIRSITITRDAQTPDGPSRRVVYSDLHI